MADTASNLCIIYYKKKTYINLHPEFRKGMKEATRELLTPNPPIGKQRYILIIDHIKTTVWEGKGAKGGSEVHIIDKVGASDNLPNTPWRPSDDWNHTTLTSDSAPKVN